MKTLLIILVSFICIPSIQAKSIYKYFKLTKTDKVVIKTYTKDDWITPQKVFTVDDWELILELVTHLEKLPSTGSISKDFGNVPIMIIDFRTRGEKDKSARLNSLTIYGTRLRVPDNSGDGSFYAGPTDKEKAFVKYVMFLTNKIRPQIPTLIEQEVQASCCACHLEMIACAVEMCAMNEGLRNYDTVTPEHIIPYFKDRKMPVCPENGKYKLLPIGIEPACTLGDDDPQGRHSYKFP